MLFPLINLLIILFFLLLYNLCFLILMLDFFRAFDRRNFLYGFLSGRVNDSIKLVIFLNYYLLIIFCRGISLEILTIRDYTIQKWINELFWLCWILFNFIFVDIFNAIKHNKFDYIFNEFYCIPFFQFLFFIW